MAFADAGMRATALAASAALLGAALFAAMSMKFVLMAVEPPLAGPVIDMVRSPPPTPPPAPEIERPNLRPLISEPIIPLDATPPLEVNFPPTQTDFPTFAAQPPVVTDPHWRRQPRDLSRYYPPRARAANVEGQVVLDCAVSAQGALACAVAQETPEGWGFGAAAERIARDHVMAPAMREGQAVEARYRMRVPFRLD